ncbi:hypothetical protein EXN66_Car021911 [Channa argus]|uniref:Uncharacterized protein n=1 Tax=Channa argus TaxID=215402 RepID=A0A6G1QV68_CHAAH|nr:hypothetical protein EXN66_Car021911 [Channa argus]
MQIGRTSSCTLEDTQLQSRGTPAERDRERGTEEDKDNYGREHTELMTYSGDNCGVRGEERGSRGGKELSTSGGGSPSSLSLWQHKRPHSSISSHPPMH